jgi:hypothetical protein
MDNPEMEYSRWIQRDGSLKSFFTLNSVNVKDTTQFRLSVVPVFRFNHATIDFYLANIVFPKAAKQFPFKLATSGWDIAEEKLKLTTGFSGTNDNHYLLPSTIHQEDPIQSSSTNALVLTHLLRPENNHYCVISQGLDEQPVDPDNFLRLLSKQKPEIRVLLDVGAQMLEMRNKELVSHWLSLNPRVSAGVFFDEHDELAVLTRDGSVDGFVSSPYRQQLDRCIVYLDDAHTRGTDLKLPPTTRAAVTLGPRVTKDRLLQGTSKHHIYLWTLLTDKVLVGCMRMRQLGKGQTIMFFAPEECDNRIRALSPTLTTSQSPVQISDILRWAMSETCADIERYVPHWTNQGIEHLRRNHAQREYHATGDLRCLKDGWLAPEARTLEQMYGLNRSSEHLSSKALRIPNMRKRLETLGVSMVLYSGMEEEQEREVAHEIERERQIERPPRAPPASHTVDEDVTIFIKRGVIPPGSKSFRQLFAPLRTCSKDAHVWSQSLFATSDFERTIQSTPGVPKVSAYMRPLQWIISSRCGAGKDLLLVALSPYEVDVLLPIIRASNLVNLHIFSARVTKGMRSFTDLQFYTVPPLPENWTLPSVAIRSQLNLWAGSLFLDDYSSYVALGAFLGIFTSQSYRLYGVDDIERHADGFVPPRQREKGGTVARLRLTSVLNDYGNQSFQENPIEALKELVGLRRYGMTYLRTHTGHLLHGHQLYEKDF